MVHELLSHIVSGDSHLEIDSKAWIDRVPSEHRDRAPRLVRLADGADAWVVEGAPPQEVVMSLYAGKDQKAFRPFRQTYEDSVGTGSPEQRLEELDTDHLDAEVIFPGVNGPRFWRNIRDDDTYLAFLHAFNAYLAEEYCATDPNRLLGVGVIPWTNVTDAIDEMRFCREAGLQAVLLGVFPNGSGKPLPEDDAFWAASLDLDVLVTVHTQIDRSQGGALTKMIDMRDTSERARRSLPNDWVITEQVTCFARDGGFNAMQLAMTGVFDRFPDLSIFFAETQIGWIPTMMEMADQRFKRHSGWINEELGWTKVKNLPSDYIRNHCYWGFQQDRFGVENRHWIGSDKLVWATDFPHQETIWPESMKIIDFNFEGVPLDEVELMTSKNAAKLFRLQLT